MAIFSLYGLGNALVDSEFHVKEDFLNEHGIEKGIMTLIDYDRLRMLEEALGKDSDLKKQASGGSAANTLIAAANFGSTVFYTCKVACDALGDFYHGDLIASGVNTNLLESREYGATGRCLVLVTDDAERTLATFLGVSADLGPEAIDEKALQASDMLYIEGYLASSERSSRAALEAYQIAKENNISIALTFSDQTIVTFFRDKLEAIIGGGIDLLFCNEQEARQWGSCSTLRGAFDQLKEIAATWVCTQGKNGVTVFDGNREVSIPGRAVRAIDTNGAGDMFAGAFLHGIHQGWSFEKAARFGVHTSSHLVTQYGPRLFRTDHISLLNEFETTT